MFPTDAIERTPGGDALARGAWEEARSAFETALRTAESPESLEGLGTAAWWLDLADTVFDARERAYRIFLKRGDRRDAARIAIWLAWDYWAFRGESAVANGWLQRARSLLQDQPPCWERAWLEVREGSLLLLGKGDPVRAEAFAAEGIRLATAIGNIDMEMLARAVQGLALVCSGQVSDGMAKLDEVSAAIIAGELTDRVAIGLSGCYLIAACERVRDCDRALQWCRRIKEFCARWGLRPLFAVCRTQYASICIWRGTWLEAEQELHAANAELAASRPAMTGDALVRLADLCRRQGRLIDAAALLDLVAPGGDALLGRAELALENADPASAADQAERFLRHLPEQNRTDRALALEILLRALVGLQQFGRAAEVLAELQTIAILLGTLPLNASLHYAAGRLAAATGKLEEARRNFEDAVDLYLRCGAPFETGRSRLELARTLAAQGRSQAAIDQAQLAFEAMAELKAALEQTRAEELLRAISATSDPAEPIVAPVGRRKSGALTARELDVLRLVADGLNNQHIGRRLFVSEHTVHRHLANIFAKLDAPTRAAAVAQAVRRGLLS